jgi:hypothetical protein
VSNFYRPLKGFFQIFSGEAVQVRPQFVPRAAKLDKPLFLRALDGCRIVEAGAVDFASR